MNKSQIWMAAMCVLGIGCEAETKERWDLQAMMDGGGGGVSLDLNGSSFLSYSEYGDLRQITIEGGTNHYATIIVSFDENNRFTDLTWYNKVENEVSIQSFELSPKGRLIEIPYDEPLQE